MNKYLLSALYFALLSPSAYAADDAFVIHGFADVVAEQPSTDQTTAFKLGGFDLFMTKNLDKKTSFLAELVFEQKEDGGLGTDLERVYLAYQISPWLRLAAGRFHTGLGYFNETFHHGSYLYYSVTRPFMFRFEDGGGFLPLHSIGLEARGNGDFLGNNLGYIVNIGNGRGITSDPPQNARDANKTKSFAVVGYYEMLNGLRFGANYYQDKIPGGVVKTQAADPADNNRVVETSTITNSADEKIYGVHLVYIHPAFELLSEYLQTVHKYQDGADTTVNIKAYYAQLALHFGKLTPFYRYEITDPDKNDPYTGLTNLRIVNTSGVRYEISESSCLKLQYEDIARAENLTSAAVAWSW